MEAKPNSVVGTHPAVGGRHEAGGRGWPPPRSGVSLARSGGGLGAERRQIRGKPEQREKAGKPVGHRDSPESESPTRCREMGPGEIRTAFGARAVESLRRHRVFAGDATVLCPAPRCGQGPRRFPCVARREKAAKGDEQQDGDRAESDRAERGRGEDRGRLGHRQQEAEVAREGEAAHEGKGESEAPVWWLARWLAPWRDRGAGPCGISHRRRPAGRRSTGGWR